MIKGYILNQTLYLHILTYLLFGGEVVTLNNDEYNVLNPTVIIEVLSPSTKNYGRGEKSSNCIVI